MPEPAKILFVDDERSVLRAIERLFLDDEYEILTALSGEEGLAVLESVASMQVVVSDYRMPRMNGVDFLKQVHARWPDTIRIVLSGYADTATVVAAVNEGQIYRFVGKPWNDDELRITLDNAVETYNLNQMNRALTERLQEYNEELADLNRNLQQRVEEETAELVARNVELSRAQQILDSLPCAVLGLDPDGTIIHCNRKGDDFFSAGVGSLVGTSGALCLPTEIMELVAEVSAIGELRSEVAAGDRNFLVRACGMRSEDGRHSVILVVEDV
jgi:two-component system NtrC family sensor kinase